MDENIVIPFFLEVLDQIKLFHWATSSYAKHKALDELHESLSDKADLFIEAYVGKYKKQPLKGLKLSLHCHSDIAKMENALESYRDHMNTMCKTFSKSAELVNILQDMMAQIDKTLYLCRLE